jgi:hypothetical protein
MLENPIFLYVKLTELCQEDSPTLNLRDLGADGGAKAKHHEI